MTVALKYLTYFLIAAGTVFASQATPPVSAWDWVKLGVSALVAGCIAIKALEADSPVQTTKIDNLQTQVSHNGDAINEIATHPALSVPPLILPPSPTLAPAPTPATPFDGQKVKV